MNDRVKAEIALYFDTALALVVLVILLVFSPLIIAYKIVELISKQICKEGRHEQT
ncbi:hypothetical protein IT415_01600 [bacterium]|nr:hypothetical protein [bacterium]